MKVTINDIAKITNVSKSTISRVLNESGPVSEHTRSVVMKAIKQLNYHPNEIARSLSLKKTHTIGLIVEDIRNPWYAQACWFAERIFRRDEYRTVICNADNDPEQEEYLLNMMKFRNVEGILCIGMQEDATSILNFKSREDIPITLVDREIKGYNIHTVNFDNAYGGQLVVDYLFSLGHTEIAFLTSGFTDAERLRQEGYMAGFRNRGVPVSKGYIVTQPEETWHRGECPGLVTLMKRGRRPTALFASNDYKALQVLRILRHNNIQVPGDVSLVGYDDIDVASMVSPALTTVHQPIDKMIELGARMLLEQITQSSGKVEKKILRPWLVERESTRRLEARRAE
ncbi:MAG TPA: LacI family DNA-binding transcriptional regulator [Spirochaetia bacterium]